MIQIITTGGTIEGLEYDNENNVSKGGNISISELLDNITHEENYIVQKVFSKDSRFITDEDRNTIFKAIKKSLNKKILITHGTLTMVETAQYLGKLKLDKTIVLTGAFILGTKENTDARFNLEFALDTLSYLKRGVYIAIQGRIFYWDNVRKNVEENRFETLSK